MPQKQEKYDILNMNLLTGTFLLIFKKNDFEPKIQICDQKIYRNVDREMLVRIFENIISNAIKYSDKDLSVVLDNSGKIIFANKTFLLDSVSVKKIFDRYYTVENAKKDSGVGLSIAKQLVQLNNGNISAKYIKNKLIIEISFNN